MNKLSVNHVGHNVVDLSAFRRRRSTAALVCHWRRDASTGALNCVWSQSRGLRESGSPVPLRRTS